MVDFLSMCNVFSHWLRPCSVRNRKWARYNRPAFLMLSSCDSCHGFKPYSEPTLRVRTVGVVNSCDIVIFVLVRPTSFIISIALCKVTSFIFSNLEHPDRRTSNGSPDSKVHGTNMGPTWVLSAPDGLHVGPMNLAIRWCTFCDMMAAWHGAVWRITGHLWGESSSQCMPCARESRNLPLTGTVSSTIPI